MSQIQILPADVLPAIRVVVPGRHRDSRGFFSEVWHEEAFREAGIDARFVQDNHVASRAAGTLRGMHFQVGRSAQGKLVRCSRGRIFDVVVDLRAGSPTFGRHTSIELSAENWKQLYIPIGFAHGYCTLEPDTEVIYKVTAYYDPAAERGFAWNDSEVGIAWPLPGESILVSDKDAMLPRLAELPGFFSYPEFPDEAHHRTR